MKQIAKKYYNEKTNEEIIIYPWTDTKTKIKVQGENWTELFTEGKHDKKT